MIKSNRATRVLTCLTIPSLCVAPHPLPRLVVVLFFNALWGLHLGADPSVHPIWNPNGNVRSLSNRVTTFLSASPTQLRHHVKSGGGFEVHRANAKRMPQVTYDLALLYHLTGKSDYAVRTAHLLDRYAEVFPQWAKRFEAKYKAKNSRYRGKHGLWSKWFVRDMENAQKLALAYDLIYNSPAFGKRSPFSRARIEQGLTDIVKQDLKAFRLTMHNHMFERALGHVIFGRVLENHELAHFGYWLYAKMMHEAFFYDGYILDGSHSYHKNLCKVLTDYKEKKHSFYLDGYSTPPSFDSYQPLPDTFLSNESTYDKARITHYQCADLWSEHWRRMNFLWTRADALPNRKNAVFNEAHHPRKPNKNLSPLDHSFLIPGLGHAILTQGKGSAQTQVRLNYGTSSIHIHQNALHLIYYSKGQEILGGTGYTAGDRKWNKAVFNQNLVVVNRKGQKEAAFRYWTMSPYVPGEPRKPLRDARYGKKNRAGNLHNNLLLWETGFPNRNEVQVVEAEALDAYRDTATRYQRLLALVELPHAEHYVIDLFRVKGGREYHWTAHGGHDPYHVRFSHPLSAAKGSLSRIHLKQKRKAPDTWSATFDYGKVKGLLHMLGSPDMTLYRGTAPNSPALGGAPMRQQDYVLARREAKVGDEVDYVGVYETYRKHPSVKSIQRLTFTKPDERVLGLKIELPSKITDYVLHSLTDQEPFAVHHVAGERTPISLQGRFAHIRVRKGKMEWMKLLQGKALTFGKHRLTPKGKNFSHEGLVVRVLRKERGNPVNAFETDAQTLPQGNGLKGKLLLVTWGNGWSWGHIVERVDGAKVVVTDEPGFDYGGSYDQVVSRYHPINTYPGPVTFRIPGSAYMDARGQIR